MNIVFEEIKKAIKSDAEKYAANEEGVLEITEENDNYIAVYEDIDGFSREYTITNPDVITKEWIKELIIVTDSAKELEFIIDTDKLADFAASLDKNMLLTLENIVIVNDAEKDYDYLSALDDSFARMLEVSDLPDEHLIGLMWFSYQKVFVNLGSIIKATYCGGDKPSVDTPIQLRLYEKLKNVNYMIHSHCYIKNAPFTSKCVPCGAVEEVDEIIKAIVENYTKEETYADCFDRYVLNLIGHGSIVMARDIKGLQGLEYYGRPMPEKMWSK